MNDWFDFVYDIYVMEKISYSLKVEKEKFYRIRSKCTEYVKPIRPDFS